MPYPLKERDSNGGTQKIVYPALEIDNETHDDLICLVVHDFDSVIATLEKARKDIRDLIADMERHNRDYEELAREIRLGNHPGMTVDDAKELEKAVLEQKKKIRHLERVIALMERLLAAMRKNGGEGFRWCWDPDSNMGRYMKEILERSCPRDANGDFSGFPGEWNVGVTIGLDPGEKPRDWRPNYP